MLSQSVNQFGSPHVHHVSQSQISLYFNVNRRLNYLQISIRYDTVNLNLSVPLFITIIPKVLESRNKPKYPSIQHQCQSVIVPWLNDIKGETHARLGHPL